MPKRASVRHPDARELAEEIIRRAAKAQGVDFQSPDAQWSPYVVRLGPDLRSNERLQLLAARLQRRPVVTMPAKCHSVDEWVERYANPRATADKSSQSGSKA